MSDDSLTHADLSRLLGVSVTTLKSYRRKFPGFIEPLNAGKPLRFPASAVQVCAGIRDGFGQGLSVREIHDQLTSRFPSPSNNRRLSISKTSPEAVSARALESLAREVADLTHRLDAALARLDTLEARPAATPAPEPGRIIRIRAQDGSHQRFRLTPLGPDPDEAAVPDAQAPAPPGELLDNPLVVHSPKGEFLGIAGTRSRHFRLRDLLGTLAAKHPDAPAPAWKRTGAAWVFTLPLPDEHVLSLESTTTPRGNQVTLLASLAIAGQAVPQAFLHAFLRQLGKEQE